MWFYCLYISKVICWQETSCFVYNILMIWQISVGITKLVLLWKIIFSAHDLLDDLNVYQVWKMFHTFVRCEFVTLWSGFNEIGLCREGYHSNCILHVLILHMLWFLFYFILLIWLRWNEYWQVSRNWYFQGKSSFLTLSCVMTWVRFF